MKNTIKRLSLLLALVLLAFAACTAADTTTTDPVAEPTGSATTNTDTTTADLPSLPRLEAGNPGAGGGMGGGGGYEGGESMAPAGEVAVAEPYPVDGDMAIDAGKMSFAPYDIFSGTQFVLNATLPSEPTQALVQRAPEYALTAEEANLWAQRFGFPTPLYQEVLPADFYTSYPEGMGQPRMPYYSFNGTAQLNISGYGVFYYDSGFVDTYPSLVDFAQSRPIAETFLRERGLLDGFEYVMEEGYNGDVTVKRLVAGQPLNYPEIYVHMNNNYEIIYVNYNPIMGLQEVGQYPLITAQAAWEQLQAGISGQNVPYELLPTEEQLRPVEDPYAAQYKYWQRVYQAGEAMTGYNGITAYQPADGGAPLVRYNQMLINASAEDLTNLAANVGKYVVVEGTMGEDGRTVNLTSWRVEETYPETLYLEGSVQASDQPGTLLFTTLDGVTYLVPNAPADLEAGTEVYIFAWTTRDTGAQYPTLDWQGIDKKVYFPEVQEGDSSTESTEVDIMPVDPGFGYGYGYTNITITKVELGYYYMAQWEAYPTDGTIPNFDVPPVVIQPVWKFSGTAEGQAPYTENIVLYMQAVDPSFVE